MRRGFKKTVVLLLVCVMVIGLAPSAALAEGVSKQNNVSSWFSNIIQIVKESFNRDNPENNRESEKIDSELVQSNQSVLDSKTLRVTSVEGDYEYADVEGGVAITGYNGVGGDLIIPEILGGKKVVSLGNSVFKDRYNIISVIIPDGVSSIGDNTFSTCTSLKIISMPKGIISIGKNAFFQCTRLTNIDIPENLQSIGDSAFGYCESLTSISIPKGVTSIGSSAFSGCIYLSSVNIPEGITSIGNCTFNDCHSLTSMGIPLGVTSIGDNAFEDCVSLASINIPVGVTYIGQWAFENCRNLESLSIPEGTKNIRGSAFENCGGLKNIDLPDSLEYLGVEAFENCYSLESINVPRGLSCIDGYTFSDCTNLKNVIFSENLTSIGSSAFSNCKSLISVSIPESVTEIKDGAFFGCDSLTNINIPEGVRSIEYSVFLGCGLTSINIPENVISIESSAFSGCDSLTNITIPESVMSIGEYTFSNCDSLTSIIIPKSVTSIGDCAFHECSSLKSIQINSPTTIIIESDSYWNNDYFCTIPSTATIIGYDPSTAKDYATEYGNPFQILNDSTDPGDDAIITVSGNEVFIKVRDIDSKEGIAGVTVSLDGRSATTGSGGLATYENPTAGEHALSIKCPGYLDYESSLMVKTGGGTVIYLQKDTGDNKPYLTQVNLKKGSMAASDVRQYEKVFIGVSKESDLTDDDYGLVEMKANLRGQKLKRYILSQNGKAVMESTTGKFDRVALAEKFAAGSPIYAMVETQDGSCSRAVKTKIKIMSASFKWGTEDSSGAINLGKSMGATIPSDLPVLGGTEIDLNMDFIPATVTVTPDRFKIALGAADMKNMEDNWSSFKKTIDDAKDTANRYKNLKKVKEIFGAKAIGMTVTSGWKTDMDIVGYIEGTIVDGQPVVTKGAMLLKAGGSYSQQTQYIIGPVPVYLEVGAGLDMELMGEIARLIPESGEVKLTTELTVTPNFELGGGVGIASVVTVGAAGKAELGLLRRFSDDYYKISLTGSMSLKAKALLFEAKKEIAKGTWVIKEGYGNQQTVNASEGGTGIETFNIYDSSQYSPMSRDYVQNPSPWSGESLSTQAITNTNQTLQVLQTNVFPNAQPRMATIGDSQVMIWTADNTGRTAANRTMLVYSVYNQSSQTWSTPAAVSDDGTADFYPQIGSDGSNLWVTWQNSKTTFADTATLAETASAGEIAVVRYNPATHAFEAPKTLTNNDTLDTQPQIAVSGDKATVVWTSNSASDLFGTTGRNTISGAEFTGTWSEPKTWVDDQNAITGISLGYVNSTSTAAYTLDGDNDLNTIDDRDLFTATPNQLASRLTQDESLDANPLFALLNGVDTLFWYHNSNIAYVPASNLGGTPGTVFAEAPQGKGDAFNVISNKAGKTALIWTETKDTATEIYSAVYDENQSQWSNTIQISNLDSRVQFPCGLIDPNGNYKIAFNRQNAGEETTPTCDLCVLGVTPATNLTLNDLSFSAEVVQPGGQLPVELDVTNTGQLTVDQLIIDVKDGDTLVQSIPLSETLKPGETKTLSVAIALPETISRKDYALSIRPATADDYDQQDNAKTLAIGYTDLALTLEEVSSGNGTSITAALTNLSCMPTDATLKVTEDTPDGKVLYTKDIKTIQKGTNLFDVIELDPKTLTFTSDVKQIYVSVTATGNEEISTGDNSDFIVIDNPNATVDPDDPGQAGFVAFLGKDPNGTYYEYSAADLNNAYLAYQINPALSSAKMYQQFLTSQCRVIALKDGAKGYMDYNAAATASLMAQMKGEAFDINAYLAGAEAKQLEETVGMVKTVDKDGNIL